MGLNAPLKVRAHVEPMTLRAEAAQAAAEFDRKLALRLAAVAETAVPVAELLEEPVLSGPA